MSGRPLLVFADDWGRHPSSAQHLIGRLLDRHPVMWVNTIGTRTPSVSLDTLRRGLEKLRHWTAPASATTRHPNLQVVSPWMWPWFSSAWDRRLNRALLTQQLRPLIEALPAAPVGVTTLPIVADLLGGLPVQRWVYYCVDDFGQWPGLDGPALRAMEQDLVRKADDLIAVSETLRQRLADMGRAAHLLTHGVDLDFWRTEEVQRALPEVADVPRPLVVFWGVIDQRMDVAMVRRLAQDMARGTILLAGPQQQPDPQLGQLPRVVLSRPLAFDQLPRLAQVADVLVMPYADLPVTRAMQPLKLKEYLATGKPVVVRDLPATQPWSDCLDLARSPGDFSALVQRRLRDGLPKSQELARQRLVHENWTEKADAFVGWVCSVGEQPSAAWSEMAHV